MAGTERLLNRRAFLETASSLAMAGGLVAGYGTFVAYAGRYLYPARGELKAWLYVAQADSIEVGQSLGYRTPTGATVVIARKETEFIALSSTCPHLGCQVRWEAHNSRFFCPCHNGVFTPEGKGIGGPPGEAGQSLGRYPLKVENGLLFIEVPVVRVVADSAAPGEEGVA